jgi:PAS domain S-box-containing protein
MGKDGRETVESALDELPVGVMIARAPTGEVLLRNQAFRRIMGTVAPERVGLSGTPAAYGLHDREGRPYPVEGLPFVRALHSGGPVVVDDMVIHHPAGGRSYLRAFAQPVRDQHDQVTHVVVALTDITAEVRAVAERAQIEKHLAVAIHHAPVLLFTMDRDSVLTATDGALRGVLEQGRGSVVGLSMLDAYKHHPTVPGHIRRALAGETVSYTVEVRGVVMDVWLGPLRDAAGELAGAIGVCTDITERQRLQAEVTRADRVRALGTMAASVAHEINNPLTYVLGGLEVAKLELDDLATELGVLQARAPGGAALAVALRRVDHVREQLALAVAGSERIRQVARDLGTFMRPKDEPLEPIDVAAVARSALKLVRKEIEARARLVDEVAPCPVVQGNEARLVQVLVNLLINAWQALPAPSDPARAVIGVRTGTHDGQAVIEVWDSGPGVPPQLRGRIFEPFMTTKSVGEGTGLGLFVCRSIVQSLQGSITVHDAPGGGALFRVLLPAAARADAPSAAAPEGGAQSRVDGGRRRNILIIDDDQMVAQSLAARFRNRNFDVRLVFDARRGLDILLAEEDIDLAYCDVMMNGFSGIDVYESLRSRHPERAARIVLMSGGSFTREAQAFLAQFPDAFVEKPFDIVADAQRRIG